MEPLRKKAFLKVEVLNSSEAKALLRQFVREYDAQLVNESFSETEGLQNENFSIQVPVENFDNLISRLSGGLGDIKVKEITSTGSEHRVELPGKIELTLLSDQRLQNASPMKKEDSAVAGNTDFSGKSGTALKSGWDGLKNFFLFLLPFWPVFLVALIIIYFIRKNRNKKDQTVQNSGEMTTHVEDDHINISEKENENMVDSGTKEEPDYSKYLPKK